MRHVEWTQVIPIAIGVFGAVLSAYTLYTTRKEKLRTIKVAVSNGFLTSGPQISSLMLFVQASNPGNRTVTLTGAGLFLPKNSQVILPAPQSDVIFPHELHEGKSCVVWINARELATNLLKEGYSGRIKIRGFVRSGIGTVYKSTPFSFDVNEWAALSE